MKIEAFVWEVLCSDTGTQYTGRKSSTSIDRLLELYVFDWSFSSLQYFEIIDDLLCNSLTVWVFFLNIFLTD